MVRRLHHIAQQLLIFENLEHGAGVTATGAGIAVVMSDQYQAMTGYYSGGWTYYY